MRFQTLSLSLLFFLVFPATGHSTFEAQELEIHVINDEGSDMIEAYGGYDITEVYVGGIQIEGRPALYFRIELYGQLEPHTTVQEWDTVVSFDSPVGPVVRGFVTADGQTFQSSFDALEIEVEGRDVHVQRAILFLDALEMSVGDPIRNLVVKTYYGDDPRDVAPGGIYVPGTGGALEYPDPTQIDGKGRLVEAPAVPDPGLYIGAIHAQREGYTYTLEVQNGLKKGAQHMILSMPNGETPTWNTTIHDGVQEMEANATGTFRFTAQPARPDSQDLKLWLATDVGGLVELAVHADGRLTAGENVLLPRFEEASAKAPGPWALVAILAAAIIVRRR